jgi:hypothetical protein
MNFIYFISFFVLFFLLIFYKKKNKFYIDQNQNKKFDTNINDEFIVPNIEQNSEIEEIVEQNLDPKYNQNVCRGEDGRYKSLKK